MRSSPCLLSGSRIKRCIEDFPAGLGYKRRFGLTEIHGERVERLFIRSEQGVVLVHVFPTVQLSKLVHDLNGKAY